MSSLLGYQGGNTGRGEGLKGILTIETRAWLPGPKNSERPVKPKNGSALDLPLHPYTVGDEIWLYLVCSFLASLRIA